MGVQPPASYLVTPWLRHQCAPIAGKQRTHKHDGTPQSRSLMGKLVALQRIQIHLVGLKLIAATIREEGVVVVEPAHLHPQQLQQINEPVHIADVGYILNNHPLTSQQHSTQHLQRLILRPLGLNVAMQLVASLYFE